MIHRPSIGRYTKLEEPKARESLLTPSMKHSASKSSLKTSGSSSSLKPSSSGTLSVEVPQLAPKAPEKEPPSSAVFDDRLTMVQAANAALMERTPFAIDDARDDGEDESDDELEDGDNDDQVMDEVRYCS